MLRVRRTEAPADHRGPSATRPRFALGGGWLDRLRPARRVRPLQISEVAQTVEEHLRAAALVSLESHYLPTRLTIRISDADWSSLRAFEGHLRRTLADVYARLAEQPKLAVTMTAPAVTFDPASRLSLGDPPVIESTFDARVEEASWWPGKDRAQRSSLPLAYAEGGVFEVLTTASRLQGTARQGVVWICFAAELPLELLDSDAPAEDRLRRAADGDWEGGWSGEAPEKHDLDTQPSALAELVGGARPAPVWRFRRPQAADVLWAGGGVVVVGRQPGRAHWVPEAAPRNLSASHLALSFDPVDGLVVADLESTNGVYVDGSRLAPLRLSRLCTPAVLDVGTEGAMRFEIRAGVRVGRGRLPPEP